MLSRCGQCTLKILIEPDTILRKKSYQLEKVDDEVRSLMDDMLETMYAANGIGLAAIQVGVAKRVIVIDIERGRDEEGKELKGNPMYFVNPEIIWKSEERYTYEEGCLSIPNTFIEIERPKTCLVEYIDIEGKKKNIECDGLLSTCIQHEINHLDGKLIIDFLSKLKKDLIIKKLSKTKKNTDRILV